MAAIGQSVQRVDALEKVKGSALYPGDYNLPDQAYMKILYANRPHAIVKKVDTTQAEAMPGVLGVYTSKDVPDNIHGMIIEDRPVICGPHPQPGADRVRFTNDYVAVVVAENEDTAARARDKIVVEYEDLPAVTDPFAARRPDAPLIHPERGSNIIAHFPIRKGNVEEAFNKADVIIEGIYKTPMQEHAYLQPEAGIAYIDEEGRIAVVVGAQCTHEDQHQIAHALGLPLDKVRVIYPYTGGAFGGREDVSVQIVLALAVWKLQAAGKYRPVKIIWSREESINGHCKRHAYTIHTRWGATKEGTITAIEAEIVADGGAYIFTSTKVLNNAKLCVTGPYEAPNVKVDAYAVYTNNVPGGAYRGFGAPQAHFAAENQMNKLAEALKMDPVELRMKNLMGEGSIISMGSALPPGVSVIPVTQKCAEAAGWKRTAQGWQLDRPASSSVPGKPHLKRGIGIGSGFKNVGFSYGFQDNCWATIELYGGGEIERAVVRHAASEVGQGTHTVIKQMAADALGIPFEKVELVVSDTAKTDFSGSVSASRMTFMASNAVKGAADLALEKWGGEERPAVGRYQYLSPATTNSDPVTGACTPNFAYGYVAETAEVEVDTETGQIRLLNVICADDVGKALNPQNLQGQIEGAVVQCAGYTLLENFVTQHGYIKTSTFSTYLIPTILDVPEHVESIIMEIPDPRGAWGVRGMGEMPFIPLPAAIIAAVHAATGVWFDEFPLTPERVLKGLKKGTTP